MQLCAALFAEPALPTPEGTGISLGCVNSYEQRTANAELVQVRLGMGDVAEHPRALDHFAYVPRRSLKSVIRDLEAAGFRIASVKKGFRRSMVEFSRIDAADLTSANAVTGEIMAIVVDKHGGMYDGWAAVVLTDADL